MVSSSALGAALALAAVSLSGCGSSSGKSNDEYCPGTPIELGDCQSSLATEAGDCSEVCVLNLAMTTDQAPVGVEALKLLSSVQGTVYNTSNSEKMVKLTIHPSALPAVVAAIDDDTVCLGFNQDTLNGLSSDKKTCAEKVGMKAEFWKESAALKRVDLSSSATLSAVELTGDYDLDLSLSSSARATVGRVHGTSLSVTQSSSSSLNVQKMDFARISASVASSGDFHVDLLETNDLNLQLSSSATAEVGSGSLKSLTAQLSSSAHASLGKLEAATSVMSLSSSAQLEGLVTSESLQVDLSSSASVTTTADAKCSVSGTCGSSSSLSVSGADISGVKGDCTGSFALEMV